MIKTAILPNETQESLFVVTQVGEIYFLKNNILKLFLDIKNRVLQLNEGYDERGLLGLAFHPNFQTNGLFYLHYSIKDSNGTPIPNIPRPNPCNIDTLNLDWKDRNRIYDHIDTIEEWQLNGNEAIKKKTILNIIRPFCNHNGVNTLTFLPNNPKLIFSNGDGGFAFDPFDLSQNDSEIFGKIIEINIDNLKSSFDSPITKFIDIPEDLRSIYKILGKGIRNASGITYQLINDEYYYFLGQVGQNLVESVYTFKFDPEKIINFGWRGWEGNLPATLVDSCAKSFQLNKLSYAFYEETLHLTNERLIPLTAYYHFNADRIVQGSAIIGISPYNGDIKELQNKIVYTDFLSKKPTKFPTGALGYTNNMLLTIPNPAHEITINYDFGGPAFFVSLGSNLTNTKLYLGVYHNTNFSLSNQGAIYEIINVN